MKRTIKMMVGTALVLGAAVPALAQDSAKPIGLSLRAGLFVPTDRNVRDVSDSWFAAGLDYKLRDLPSGAGLNSLTLSLDYTSKSNFRMVPVLLNYVVHRNQLYVFGGAGISFSRYPTGGGGRTDKTEFGYQLGAGYDFQTGPTPLFVEAKFMGNGRSDLNGFGFFAGVRF